MYNLVSDAVKKVKVLDHFGMEIPYDNGWNLPWTGWDIHSLDRAYQLCKEKERDEADKARQHQGL